MSGALTLTGEERDALYEAFEVELTAVDDLQRAVGEEQTRQAHRLSGELCDALKIVRTDLGWGRQTGKTVELRTEPEIALRVLLRWRQAAKARYVLAREDLAKAEEDVRASGRAVQIFDGLIKRLSGNGIEALADG